MQDYQPSPDLLKDRVILVTGAGDGIGRAMAKAFAAHGATVILLGRTLAKLEKVYDEIEEAGHPQPAIYPMNLEGATPQDYQDLADKVDEVFDKLDGILHNAAQLQLMSRIDDYDVESWFKVMQVNLNAPFLLTQACLPLLRKSPDASVLFVSDTVGRKAKAYWGAYAVSKFGVEGLMQLLAEELRGSSHIRVNSVDPGPTRSAIRAFAYPGEDLYSNKDPEALANLYLWLMGPDSKDVHGQAVTYGEDLSA